MLVLSRLWQTLSGNAPAAEDSSFKDPSFFWTRWQCLKGVNWTRLDPESIPGAHKDLTGQWVIITGSNNGIGRSAALRFASNGANVILGCREPPEHETHPRVVVEECKSKAKANGHVSEIEWWEIDMADLNAIEIFARRWLHTGRPLDILCNNAGIGSSPGGVEVFKTKDGFEIVHQVNFISHALLTLSLLPSLAKAAEPRIVFTTSCFHFFGRYDLANFNGGPDMAGPEGVNYYQNNKLYYQIWITELHHRLISHPTYKRITINTLHPGYVNSGIWNLNRPNMGWQSYRQVTVNSLAYIFAIDNEQGSLAITHVALSPECGPDKKVQGVGNGSGKGGGRYFNRIWEDEPMPHCKNPEKRLEVWVKTAQELRLAAKGLLNGSLDIE